jgi:hypothetical protein
MKNTYRKPIIKFSECEAVKLKTNGYKENIYLYFFSTTTWVKLRQGMNFIVANAVKNSLPKPFKLHKEWKYIKLHLHGTNCSH